MRVLVACEYSGRVRNAFRALGHDAWSCDLLPSEDDSPNHYQGDVLRRIKDGWDLMIAHPPCTYLTCAAEWAYGDGPYHQQVKPGTLVGVERRAARLEAVAFVKALWNAPIPRVVIENPVGVLSREIGKPAQTIQPWQFGDDASKATCLWMRGVAPLRDEPAQHHPGRLVEHNGKIVRRWANQSDGGQNRLAPSDDRWKERSRTYEGIADAMANQWGKAQELPLFAATTPRTPGASFGCQPPIPAIREGCSK